MKEKINEENLKYDFMKSGLSKNNLKQHNEFIDSLKNPNTDSPLKTFSISPFEFEIKKKTKSWKIFYFSVRTVMILSLMIIIIGNLSLIYPIENYWIAFICKFDIVFLFAIVLISAILEKLN